MVQSFYRRHLQNTTNNVTGAQEDHDRSRYAAYSVNDNEEYATVGVLRDLINCRDGLYGIHYFNYDDITAIIDELCTN